MCPFPVYKDGRDEHAGHDDVETEAQEKDIMEILGFGETVGQYSGTGEPHEEKGCGCLFGKELFGKIGDGAERQDAEYEKADIERSIVITKGEKGQELGLRGNKKEGKEGSKDSEERVAQLGFIGEKSTHRAVAKGSKLSYNTRKFTLILA